MTTKKRASAHAPRKPTAKTTAKTIATAIPPKRSHHKKPQSAPSPAPVAVVPTATELVTVAPTQLFNPDDINLIGPGLRERAAACRAAGEPLTASPGFHLVVQKGVLDQEADPPPAPPPQAEPSLSAALKKAKPQSTAKPQPQPQPKPAAAPAAQANGNGAKPAPPTPATWGKAGSQAEAYKRLLMTTDLDEEALHKAVEAELGKGKAGPLSYVAWYRSRLRRDGFAPTGGADRG